MFLHELHAFCVHIDLEVVEEANPNPVHKQPNACRNKEDNKDGERRGEFL
jgi:hypothetical protein